MTIYMLQSAQFRDIVLKSGFINPEEFDAAEKSSKELGKDIADVLVYRGLLGEDILGKINR